MNEQTNVIESPHSVKFSINAKGQFSGEIKCYGTTPEDALKKATNLAMQVETIITEKNGLVKTDGKL